METQEDKYGLPITCRVPASVKKELANEAQERGLSFAAYLSTFIVSNHQKSASHQAELRAVYKEKEALQSNYLALQNATNWYKDEQKKKVDLLLNNERILNTLYQQYGETLLDKKILVDAGFNFSYVTNGFKEENLTWWGAFSIFYAYEKDKIKISKL